MRLSLSAEGPLFHVQTGRNSCNRVSFDLGIVECKEGDLPDSFAGIIQEDVSCGFFLDINRYYLYVKNNITSLSFSNGSG